MSLTEKSFSKGSAFPPVTKGKLRLYSMRFCPFAQRTRLVLAHKNIQHETVNVDLKEKPDWFLERNPLGLVPVLEQDDKIVYESLITCDYLDDVYPDNRLTPSDSYQKARDSMLVDYYGNKFVPNYYKTLRSQGKDEEGMQTLNKAMNKLEEEIAARGEFFGGDKPAMVDMMLWPWMERIGLLQTTCPSLIPSQTVFPKLFAWIQAMLQQPAFVPNYYKTLRSQGKDEEGMQTLNKAMNKLEEEIAARGEFFGGDKPAMVDMMLWPWMERIGLLQTTCPSLIPSQTVFPKLFAWIQAMLQQPAVKATSFDMDTHTEFLMSYFAGKPKYDIGLTL